MNDSRHALLRILADGDRHSGAALGRRLGCSRAAVWKQVEALRELGLSVEAGRGLGYQLPRPVDLLSGVDIVAALDAPTRHALASIEVLLSTSSTSDRLAAQGAAPPGMLRTCLAEHQSAGRGRRGRRWLSPLGSGICLSASWSYEAPPPDIGTLGLVVALAVTAALRKLDRGPVSVKWPNDIMAPAGKLAGILVDVAGEAGGPLRVVVGIGLNVHTSSGLDAGVTADGGAMPAALDQLGRAPVPPRNQVAAALLGSLHQHLRDFAAGGFGPYAAQFNHQDYLLGQSVSVRSGDLCVEGVARGVGADGALLVDTGGQFRRVVAGDVSLRRAP